MQGSASTDRRDVSVVLAAPATSARRRYGDYLTAAGCQVVMASTSDAALAQSVSIQPDVIAISHRLRPLDGARCCAQLKTDARTAAIPVILLATPAIVDELRAAQDAGCAVLVIQPVSPEDLFRTMRDAVARAKRLVARADRAAARSRSLIARATDARAATAKRDATAGAREFLDALPGCGTEGEYRAGSTIYKQGDRCDAVLYVRKGVVKLSVMSAGGREAVVGLVGAGDFFGEGCLTGQTVRLGSATTVVASTIVRLEKAGMRGLLHKHRDLSDRFIRHVLARNIRVEADLVDQLFNSTEKRVARTLLLLARFGRQSKPIRSIPRIAQSTLAEMVGTSRTRINFFMKKFERLGFIEYKKGLKINKGLLTVVLND